MALSYGVINSLASLTSAFRKYSVISEIHSLIFFHVCADVPLGILMRMPKYPIYINGSRVMRSDSQLNLQFYNYMNA